ncbi:MAG TPA: M20/M25/M40 family metallo-hydrolase [Thermoanaerobaculia bacterium]|nr:M20/M25/M40 family metallo-hydrolase [Thermoanaerobaculia bacterium]
MRRQAVLAAGFLILASALAAQTASPGAPAASPLVQALTGPSSRLEPELRVLTDEIGGRPSGSAAYERALQWGLEAFRRAGVEARLETYTAPTRWEGISATASVVSPVAFPLRVVSFGLAPSTPGAVRARLADAGFGSRKEIEALGEKARGAILLVDTKEMKSFAELFAEYENGPDMMAAAVASHAAAILCVSTRPRDLLYRHSITWGENAPIPMAQVAREDGERLVRLCRASVGGCPTVELDVRNKTGGPWQAQNVIAEIRGSEKPEEIVLLGAHLDSWDLGTGAQDNGVNCALVVEAARAIAAGPRPRRTVRFALFTNEETGLLGSRGYVQSHRDEMSRHVAVVIHDIGDGRVKGYFTNGRPELNDAVAHALEPAAALGANGLDETAILGTDNFDFLLEGVPNLVADQETERYLPDYHAASDTFDKIDLDMARRNAAVAAIVVSGLANAPSAPGPRQSRGDVARILADPRWKLDTQMKSYGLWDAWQKGERGRKP